MSNAGRTRDVPQVTSPPIQMVDERQKIDPTGDVSHLSHSSGFLTHEEARAFFVKEH
ncbi:MAG: hypothetical protein MUC92_12205 [Fimbriimonadaceae bacterium]|jgi:hypothetical protein|nr:hypothetical protein [Fimbriimonadaceae bacterium]